MVFGSDSPLSQYAQNPDYADKKTARKLALLGYDQTGQQNTWGKISSWMPGTNMFLNQGAKSVAANGGANDTMNNIKEDFDNRLSKTAIVAGVAAGGLGLAGAAGVAGTGAIGTFATKNAADLMKGGLDLTTQFGGSLAFDQNDLVTEGQYIYR